MIIYACASVYNNMLVNYTVYILPRVFYNGRIFIFECYISTYDTLIISYIVICTLR